MTDKPTLKPLTRLVQPSRCLFIVRDNERGSYLVRFHSRLIGEFRLFKDAEKCFYEYANRLEVFLDNYGVPR